MSTNSAIFSAENLIKAYNQIKVELTRTDFPLDIIYLPIIKEIDSNTQDFFEGVSRFINSGNLYIDPIIILDVPKSEFKQRNIALVGLIDRIIYHSIFNFNSFGSLYNSHINSNVSFSREINEESKYFLEDYKFKYKNYVEKQIKAYKDGYSWRLIVDIERFYDQINHEILLDSLESCFSGTAEFNQASSILRKILKSWFPDGTGIPQGPEVSHVYAHIYLSTFDKVLQKISKGKDIVVMRYQDDVVVMTKDEEVAKECFSEISKALKNLKLTVNNKTDLKKLFSEDELLDKLFSSSHSDIEFGIQDKINIDEIENIIYRITDRQKPKDVEISKLKYFLKASNPIDYPFLLNIIRLYDYAPQLSVFISRYYSKFLDQDSILTKSYIDYFLEEYLKSDRLSDWARYWVLRLLIYKSSKQDQQKIIKLIENDPHILLRITYILLNRNKTDIEGLKNSYELISFISNSKEDINQKDLNNLVLRNINNSVSKDLTAFLWLFSRRLDINNLGIKSDFYKILDGAVFNYDIESNPSVYNQNHLSFNIFNNIQSQFYSNTPKSIPNLNVKNESSEIYNKYRLIFGQKFEAPVVIVDEIDNMLYTFKNSENVHCQLQINNELKKRTGFYLLNLISVRDINTEISPDDKESLLLKIPTLSGDPRKKKKSQNDFINYEKDVAKIVGFRILKPIKNKRGFWTMDVQVLKRVK